VAFPGSGRADQEGVFAGVDEFEGGELEDLALRGSRVIAPVEALAVLAPGES
jgi:hypothetical protein